MPAGDEQTEADQRRVLGPPLVYDEHVWRRLARSMPPDFEAALAAESRPGRRLRTEALRVLAATGRPTHVPSLLTALTDSEPATTEGVVKGVVLALSRAVSADFRDAMLVALTPIACGEHRLPLTPATHSALAHAPEAMTRLDPGAPRGVLSSPRCLRAVNPAVGHVLLHVTCRYDDRVRGAARALDPALIGALADALAAGPWIIPDPRAGQLVRVAVLHALATTDPRRARRILRSPAEFALDTDDLARYAPDIRAILSDRPTPEDAVYWAQDHPTDFDPPTLAVLGAYALLMETANDGLEAAWRGAMVAPPSIAEGLRTLGLASLAAMAGEGRTSLAFERAVIDSLPLARRRAGRYMDAHRAAFARVGTARGSAGLGGA